MRPWIMLSKLYKLQYNLRGLKNICYIPPEEEPPNFALNWIVSLSPVSVKILGTQVSIK